MHRPFKDAITVNASSNTLILVILTLTISLNSLIITSHYIAYHFSILFLAQKIEIYILKAHIRCSFMSVQVLLFAIRNPRITDRWYKGHGLQTYIPKAHIRRSLMSAQVLLFAIRNPRTTDRWCKGHGLQTHIPKAHIRRSLMSVQVLLLL